MTYQQLIEFCLGYLNDLDGMMCTDGPCPYYGICCECTPAFNGGIAKYGMRPGTGINITDEIPGSVEE